MTGFPNIYQGFESIPMQKFRFLSMFKLRKYTEVRKPLVIFGCYRPHDITVLLKRHKGEVVLVWMGNDSKKRNLKKIQAIRSDITHATWLPRVYEYLNSNGLNCWLLKIPTVDVVKEQVRGNNVYAYLQRGKIEYHGSKTVEKLNIPFQVIIGNHSIPRRIWKQGECEKYYSKAFVGLCLSEYSGGGYSIVEMGLRGMRVVTNVLDLPNCLTWKTVEDVEQHIINESENIGKSNIELAKEVYLQLATNIECFNINQLIIRR